MSRHEEIEVVERKAYLQALKQASRTFAARRAKGQNSDVVYRAFTWCLFLLLLARSLDQFTMNAGRVIFTE